MRHKIQFPDIIGHLTKSHNTNPGDFFGFKISEPGTRGIEERGRRKPRGRPERPERHPCPDHNSEFLADNGFASWGPQYL